MTTHMLTKNDIEVSGRLSTLEESLRQVDKQIQWLYEHGATKEHVAVVASQIADLESELTEHRVETKESLAGISKSFKEFAEKTDVFLDELSTKITLFVGGLAVTGVVFSFVVYLVRDVVFKWLLG